MKIASDKGFLGMSFELYLELLDWTGRQIRQDHKKCRIPADLAPVGKRSNVNVHESPFSYRLQY